MDQVEQGSLELTWDQGLSRYLRTTRKLSARCNLELPDFKTRVRFMTRAESKTICVAVRRRNVFARHSWENNCYIRRIRELADTTVVEVLRPGDADDMLEEAKAIATLIERHSVLPSTFTLPRADLHRVRAGLKEHHICRFDEQQTGDF